MQASLRPSSPTQQQPLSSSSSLDLMETELRFLSFSTGRRGCMGVQLGTAMTVVLLARMIQGFEWSVSSGMDGVVDLAEEENGLFLAKALEAHARPRLDNVGLYMKLSQQKEEEEDAEKMVFTFNFDITVIGGRQLKEKKVTEGHCRR
ncbi:Phenylalanine N-monooxygenase [Acorus calamus]|uniref:Phenylalanine N-monooxygenase n=1 Tax=Acorus calamus TaxID=4465 RepID=A0AAV9EZ98_ACOCL|nr:Phenylalanine N-monooxygenase [Acorus calamus]